MFLLTIVCPAARKHVKLLLTLLLFNIQLIAVAQTQRIDSLKKLINTTPDVQEHLRLLFLFCDERLSLHGDTLYAYATKARQLAQAEHNNFLVEKANYYLNNVLIKNGFFDSAITRCDNSIQWLKNNNGSSELITDYIYLKAGAFIRSNRYKEALSLNYQLLSNAERTGDTLMQVKTKTSIGWINMEMNQHKEALVWLMNALNTTSNEAIKEKYSVIYSNIASTYNNLGNLDSATYFVNKAIAGSRKMQQLTYLANALYIEADIFMNKHNNAGAENALNEALTVRQQVGDPFYIVSDITQLANFYATTGQTAKGIALAQQGIDMAARHHIDAKLPILYAALAANYKSAGDPEHYSRVLEKIISLKDSLYQKNSAEAMRSLQARYDLQRKENIIIQQQLNIVKKDYLFYGMMILFGFLLLLIYILYQNYRKRQKIKMERVVKDQQQRETIAIIKAEEAERKRIAADLHDNLGAYAAAISANVQSLKDAGRYSQQLTHRIEENVDGIVSQLSDTIWVLKKEHQLLTEISDRFKVWMQKLMRNYPAVEYDFDEAIEDDVTLTPAAALHLFHILQECVNNALKHSQCSRIIIRLQGGKDKLHITVSDNGKGFLLTGTNGGNGLGNLLQRAALCNWKINWERNEPGGTVVKIVSD